MTEELFEQIFNEEEYTENGDTIFDGLVLIKKYIKDRPVLNAAEHDIVWTVDAETLIQAGITEDDVRKLRNLGWRYEWGMGLSHFV